MIEKQIFFNLFYLFYQNILCFCYCINKTYDNDKY